MTPAASSQPSAVYIGFPCVKRDVTAGVLALGIIGLLFVVALAARGGHPTLGGQVSTRAVPGSVQDDFVTLLAIVYVVAIVAFLAVFFRMRHQWQEPESNWLRNFLTVLVLMGIITAFGYWAIRHGHFHLWGQQGHGMQGQQGGGRAGNHGLRPVATRHAHFSWRLALSVAGLVVAGAALILLRRPLPRVPFPAALEEELAQTLDTTIEDLRRERDPRRAVIAAYAGMERVLSSHGLVRRRPEAPFEYLARVLQELEVGEGAVHSLTRLFEYAKFSPHEIDVGMKEEAIAALVEVRDDLRREAAAA